MCEEQPGRILHEMRFGSASSLSLGGGTIYYGTADATPLFVMLLAEASRWGADDAMIEALLPNADRALAWIEGPGDLDRDGYVEYERRSPRGLENQGWKDSWDGIRFADGRFPSTPIALCEVQAYLYGAYVGRAELARRFDDQSTAQRCEDRASTLREAFNRDFWLPDRGWVAMGLDGEKQPIDGLASNMGHCLWTGILDVDKAEQVAAHLVSPQMFSGWGIRTLASSMACYNPLSYHNGSVWPHDNAIAVAGLMRYGYMEEAHRVIRAMLQVAQHSGGRLPELFSGLSRDDIETPVSYPTSCSPQAWAAASPLLFLRSMLGFEPDVPRGLVVVAPTLPAETRSLVLDGIPVAGRRVTVTVHGRDVSVAGLGDLGLRSAQRTRSGHGRDDLPRRPPASAP